MRKAILGASLALLFAVGVGCATPIYSSSPDVRARQLIYTSENLRHIPQTWERFWFLDMPDHTTPYRTHGGVL